MFAVILATVICSATTFKNVTVRPRENPVKIFDFHTVDQLLDAMYTVESNRGLILVGDEGKAIGPYQIWKAYWQDAVEWDKSIGGEYQDCMKKAYAEKIVRAYWKRYAPKGATLEQLARIHNGGTRGHLNPNTIKYWNKIKKELVK
tara:strand:- start:1195 stop:1632 length:438 start_codon:yes stop_codon:yes gene_type:complete